MSEPSNVWNGSALREWGRDPRQGRGQGVGRSWDHVSQTLKCADFFIHSWNSQHLPSIFSRGIPKTRHTFYFGLKLILGAWAVVFGKGGGVCVRSRGRQRLSFFLSWFREINRGRHQDVAGRGRNIYLTDSMALHIVFVSLFSLFFFFWIRNIDLARCSAVLAKPSWRLYGLRPLMRQGEGSEEIKRCAPGQLA